MKELITSKKAVGKEQLVPGVISTANKGTVILNFKNHLEEELTTNDMNRKGKEIENEKWLPLDQRHSHE